MQRINFYQRRDIGNVVTDTFAFLKENFKTLFKAILFIPGPLILLGGIAFGLYFFFLVKLTTRGAIPDPYMIREFGIFFPLIYILLFIGPMLLVSTVYEYINLYINDKETTLGEIWKGVKKRFFLTFKVFLGSFFLLFIATCIVFGVFFFLLFLGSTLGLVTGGVIAGFFFSFLTGCLAFAPFIYIAVTLSLVYSVCVYEGKGFRAGVRRSFSLISGKWWKTCGVIFVLAFISMGISMVFYLPFYLVLGIESYFSSDGDSSTTFVQIMKTVFTVVLMAGTYLIYPLLFIGINFQYFSLVEEKDATGLLKKIDSFGSVSAETENAEEY